MGKLLQTDRQREREIAIFIGAQTESTHKKAQNKKRVADGQRQPIYGKYNKNQINIE